MKFLLRNWNGEAKCLLQAFFVIFLVFWLELPGFAAGSLWDLHKAVKASKSDEVLILKDGKVVYRYSSRKTRDPIEVMSCTKSIVALAIGLAIDEGALANVDVPVSEFYPEWKKDARRNITIRHLLNHTSGLKANKTTEDIYQQPDFIKYALKSELEHHPGEHFFYNNRATNLLSGIVEKTTGRKLNDYLNERLFRKLDIRDSEWRWESDKAGNPHGMSGLSMRPQAFAKIGKLILQNGVWNEQKIISRGWLEAMLSPGQELEPGCGYLWWLKSNPTDDLLFYDESLLQQYEQNGVSKTQLERLKTMAGKPLKRPEFKEKLLNVFGSLDAANVFLKEVSGKGLPDTRIKRGPIDSYVAEGYLGQYLVIIPSRGVVGVRLIHYTSAGDKTNFPEFLEMVARL
ncbi:MAG: beta-lactamase family protein [Candidatus Riflebacteria bacterium]|nr:beta-lactamase family protein [Candidatus Riflebacteria bacterium]